MRLFNLQSKHTFVRFRMGPSVLCGVEGPWFNHPARRAWPSRPWVFVVQYIKLHVRFSLPIASWKGDNRRCQSQGSRRYVFMQECARASSYRLENKSLHSRVLYVFFSMHFFSNFQLIPVKVSYRLFNTEQTIIKTTVSMFNALVQHIYFIIMCTWTV